MADLAADFYLETVARVFQEFALPRGLASTFRGRKVDPAAIRRTALVTIEGERDDICATTTPGRSPQQGSASSLRLPYLARRTTRSPTSATTACSAAKRWCRTRSIRSCDVIRVIGVISALERARLRQRARLQHHARRRRTDWTFAYGEHSPVRTIARAPRVAALKCSCDSVATGVTPSWRSSSACTRGLAEASSSAAIALSTCISASTLRASTSEARHCWR